MIIFIESNTTGSGKLFFDFCKKEKFKFFFLTKNPKKYDWVKKNNYIECDTSNFNELRKICKKIISRHNIKIIFSTSDLYTSVAYKLSKVLKLNNNNYNFLLTCRNKIKLLKLLKNKGFISRKFGKFKFNNNHIFPIIVKPNSGTGSKNIYKFDNEKCFDAVLFYSECLRNIIPSNKKIYLCCVPSSKAYTKNTLAYLIGKLSACNLISRAFCKAWANS